MRLISLLKKYAALAVCLFLPLVCPAAGADTDEIQVCDNLKVVSAESISFTANEKIFLCGDPETSEWASVPSWQKEFYLTPVLQSKGFYNFRFEYLKNDQLVVYLEGSSRVQSIEYLNFPSEVEQPKFSEFLEKRINSDLLDEVEQLNRIYLSYYGYPCAKVQTTASVKTGKIQISISHLDLENFGEIEQKKQDKVYPEAIQRSYPFEEEQMFNAQLLDVATKRLRGQGLLNYSQFQKRCGAFGMRDSTKKKPFSIYHDLDMLKPRIVRLGVGFDTEKGPLFLAGWKNSRLSKLGSSFEIKLETSFVEQEVDAIYKWYVTREAPKFFLKSQFTASREKEDAFEENQLEAFFAPSYKSDLLGWGYDLSIGPALNYVNEVQGSFDEEEKYLLLKTQFSLWSHSYEFYETNPTKGVSTSWSLEYLDESWGLDTAVTKMGLSFTLLESFGEPIFENFILGFRGVISTVLLENDSDISKLPSDLKVFLGGSESFRGFGRKELPRSEEGGLTGVYGGVETRWNGWLPAGFQPLLFVDWVATSLSSLSLSQSERFWAPGLGLRWQSPIGAFRVTFARAYGLDDTNEDTVNDQFFLSFGEEF